MPSKKDRQRVLAEIWATPTPIDIDFFDKGDEIVVTTARRDNVVGWWLDIFTALYPNQTYREKNELVKIKPAPGVTVKLSRKTGLMKISGKNHWGWMVAHFTDVLETANNESEELDDGASLMSDNSVTRYLQLDKNVEMVQDLLDMIPDGGGIMQNDYIMKLWKSLIDDWFGCGAVVYIVTPRIDEERLFQIFLLMIRNKGTAFGVTLVIPEKGPGGEKFKKTLETTSRMMKKTRTPRANKRLVSDVKMQWALENLRVHHENFSTNFAAAYKDDEAEVLTTTAHFHKSHFHSNQKDNVCYNKLPTEDLKRNYLLPLGLSLNF